MKNTLLTERFQQLAGIRPLYQIEEGTLSDLGDKVKPTLNTIFTTSKSKSKEVFNMIKAEFEDKENQQKVKDTASKALEVTTGVYKAIVDEVEKATLSATSKITPENIKKIEGYMLSLKTTGFLTLLGGIYETVTETTGLQLQNPFKVGFMKMVQMPELGEPDIAIGIGATLVAIKLFMFALRHFLNFLKPVKRIVKKVKGMFNKDDLPKDDNRRYMPENINEDEIGDADFSDIISLFK